MIHNGTQTVSAGGMRAGPDVSWVADPATGVAVYGTYGFGGVLTLACALFAGAFCATANL